MILLLHGDDAEASRRALNDEIAKRIRYDVRRIDGRVFTDTALIQALESRSLFGTEHAVIIERLLTSIGRKTSQLTRISQILQSVREIPVILWEPGRIAPSFVKALGSAVTVREFATPVVIFRFLDGLRPRSARTLLGLYREVGAKDAPELTHAHLVKRIRHLIMVKDRVMPDAMPAWQAGRLTSQAGFFTMNELVTLHRRLLSMEYLVKTGNTPFTLAQLTEQMLTDL